MILEILYQDDYLVAINKPSGLLVHKSPIDKGEIHGYTPKEGVIDYDLKVILDAKADRDRSDDKLPQQAITLSAIGNFGLPYPISRYPAAHYSLVKLMPKTGRKHQLRRHMKHIFHPIVGDTKYGRGEHNQLFREKLDCHRLLLHASRLRFVHPLTQQIVEIEAGLDEVFRRLVT